MISFRRIAAMIQQEWYISKRSLEVVMDLPVFSTLDVIVFGFVSVFVLNDPAAGNVLLLGAVFWEIVRVTQYSMTVSSMWNVWSRNMSNLFISPLSLAEYILASVFSAVLKSAVITAGLGVLAYFVFHFSILSIGFWPLVWYGLNLVVFSASIGLVLLGLIFRYGTRIQALGWGLIYVFQPLCAIYFPVNILPSWLQPISYAIPATYVFEAGRAHLAGMPVTLAHTLTLVGLNVLYAGISLGLFLFLHHSSRTTGQLARLEN